MAKMKHLGGWRPHVNFVTLHCTLVRPTTSTLTEAGLGWAGLMKPAA